MCLLNKNCPVPFDQQPLNEFYTLKDSYFFSFFGFKLKSYIYSLMNIIVTLLVLFLPLIYFTDINSLSRGLIVEVFLITFIIILLLIRLYLGWSYVADRLFSATIFYEESGWYDGQMWIKTPAILTKDRLIAVYYVFPLLSRIKTTFIILAVIIIAEFFLYRLLC